MQEILLQPYMVHRKQWVFICWMIHWMNVITGTQALESVTRVWVLPLPLTSCVLHCKYLLACCCCCSFAKLCLTLCCNSPGFSVLHYLPKFAHIHIQWVDDASNYLILFCPFLLLILIFPSIRVFWNVSVLHIRCQSTGVSASVLPMHIQNRFPLGLTDLIPLLSKELSRVFSNTTIQKHQFFSAQLPWSNSHIHTWLLEKPQLGLDRPLLAK